MDIGNMHKNVVNIAHVVPEISSQTDRHTDKQTDILTTILTTTPAGKVISNIYQYNFQNATV